ncbi:Long chain fatty acid acyl-CoA ligase [Ceraceosorus bombacis]|uniref:Long chain fatty acid acyl-CoA ligase n=1 Tax=Ceraceosorus bombacis TaxID=401625 RepID=A0A0P1BPD6_9BASI|nr:Long chain fatty acid acyl-CoA ligase [Ceraceosorus bombacis]
MAALQLATAYVHAPLVTLNPSYSPLQLRKALNHVKAKALFIIPCLRDSDYTKHLRSILPTLREEAKGAPILRDDQVPTLQHVVLFDNITARPDGWPNLSAYCAAGGDFAGALDQLHGWAIDYRDVLDQGSQIALQEIEGSSDAAINLQLTSGTTGAPKAVVLNSINLINNATVLGNIMELTPNDLLANIPPLFHCFGLTLGNLAAWSRGAGVLYASEGFSPARALRSAARENATAIHGVPSHFVSELELLRRAKQASVMSESEQAKACSGLRKDGVRKGEVWSFGSLRTGFMSGSTIPVELMRSCIEELGAGKLTVVYGMTETSPVSFGASIHDSVERRCTTVGQIVDYAHAKIVAGDDVAGAPVPVGQAGELWIGGYLVMSEYFEDEEKTAEAIVEQEGIRWIKTGDVAVMDGEGYVQICGRVKDVIIRGGENLFPPVIENCINQLGGIAASAVVAVPHERLGEVVGVFVQTSAERGDARRPSALQIREHVKTGISGQAAPEWVWFVDEGGVGAMPTTASGKVQKVILRQWASELSAKGKGAVKC